MIMSKKNETKKKKGLGKLLAGVAIGAGLGILFAPKSGKETRKELKEKMDELINKAKNIDKKEVKENIEKKIEEIKAELKDLDKEKILKIAKTKAKQIKEKAEDLVEYAKEKGTPILEKAADSVREKAIEVTKQVLNKLEKEDK
jgi:gas vesicle protein